MIRKALPVVFASALVLTACNTNDGALPSNNETPMQDVERNNTPNDNKRMGPNLDGLDDNNDRGIMKREGEDIIDDTREGIEKTRDELIDDNNENRGARDDTNVDGNMNGNNAAPDGVLRDEDRKVR
ncbi:hypothetical protein CSV78_03920 [Sporosarcina sp. P16a]|uniref:hypothetical protein n=1 Tax=unclassified Sporosarcina TaxID=2647733 RepID=UPI000C16F3D4|nr:MULTISPECIES: hypothetical protein [unclassified Sporosarcina]PIC67948.1 hypothetical protein CSV78_03920 [Sporosarcina sp. P16a]PIC82410.1 hypothetical protein CSV73_12870 [Sporosarcina sp. P1]PIC94257.1 hypothetical protein CSV70_00560 [Sporosarcina sp. P25]